MDLTRKVRVACGVLVVGLMALMWYWGFTTIPSATEVKEARTADMLGVWWFTWGLIWLATLSGIVIAWLCWALEMDARRDAARQARDAA
jgi:hypothetical protein